MISKEVKSEFKELSLLVADDESVALDEMDKILKKVFKKVYLAEDGQKALDIFEKEKDKIDIVITDISMPNKNGLELAKDIKTLDNNIPVVIITAYSELEYLHEAINIGIDQFIQKPIDPRKLFESLKKCANTVLADMNREELEAYRLKEAVYNSKKELLKDIAHHWRNPLNAISLIITNINDAVESDESFSDELQYEIMSYCDAGSTHVVNMSHTISDFIGFINSETKTENLILKDFFLQAWNLADNSFPDIHCTLKLGIDEDTIINISKSSINFIFYQILKNSFEEFERRKIDSPMFKVYAEKSDKYNRVFFEDNGGGLSEKNKDMVFMPYASDKSVESCRGVNLFLVKKILKERNILIDYKNIENEGFILFIDIPNTTEV